MGTLPQWFPLIHDFRCILSFFYNADEDRATLVVVRTNGRCIGFIHMKSHSSSGPCTLRFGFLQLFDLIPRIISWCLLKIFPLFLNRSWLTNIIRKLQSQATALRHESATNTNGLTLSTMWEHVDSAWIELDKEVRGDNVCIVGWLHRFENHVWGVKLRYSFNAIRGLREAHGRQHVREVSILGQATHTCSPCENVCLRFINACRWSCMDGPMTTCFGCSTPP